MCRPASTFIPPPKPPRRGACGIHATVIHRTKSRLSHFRVNCNCWGCPHCVESILRPRLLGHLKKIADQNGKLFHSTCPESDWKSFYNRQIRARRYFWIRKGDVRHIFTSAPLKDGSGIHMAGKALRASIEKLIRDIPYEKCPFCCCHPWSMKCRKTEKDCELIGLSTVNIRHMQLSAESIGIKASTSFTELGEVLNLKANRSQAADLIAGARQFARTERIEAQRKAAASLPRPRTNYPYTINPRVYDSSLSGSLRNADSPHPIVV